jgi:hypothetical protein
VYPANPYDDSNPKGHEALKLGNRKLKESDCVFHENSLEYVLYVDGNVQHAPLNMLFIGSDLFKECMEEAKRLKENPNDSEALAAFTQAMKKFMYTWSQSSTCFRGQAAMLEMLVDSIAKYAGFELKRPEVPEAAQTALAQLTEKFPDNDPRKPGTETGTGYTVRIRGSNVPRKNDKKWLQDFFFHYDVFALHMPNFQTFDERYKCEFVPLQTAEPPAESN